MRLQKIFKKISHCYSFILFIKQYNSYISSVTKNLQKYFNLFLRIVVSSNTAFQCGYQQSFNISLFLLLRKDKCVINYGFISSYFVNLMYSFYLISFEFHFDLDFNYSLQWKQIIHIPYAQNQFQINPLHSDALTELEEETP